MKTAVTSQRVLLSKVRTLQTKGIHVNREEKLKHLHAIRENLITEGLDEEEGWGIDPGILETLVILNALGLKTWSSCEGHLPAAGEDPDFNNGPYIDFEPSVETVAVIVVAPSEEELDARAKRYENDELTEEDLAISEAQARQIQHDHRNMIGLLEEFYATHSPAGEMVHLVTSPLRGTNGFSLASQGTWAHHEPEEHEPFLRQSQAELKAFTEFLRAKYLDQ